MKSALGAFFVAFVVGAILFAQKHEPEIREFLGLPQVTEESVSVEKKEKSETAWKSGDEARTTSNSLENRASREDSSDETIIQQIVSERYPDLPDKNFEEIIPDLKSLTPAMFPPRVVMKHSVNTKFLIDGKLMGVGHVKSGGEMRPSHWSDNGALIFTSLAQPGLAAQLSPDASNFEAAARRQFEEIQENARQRIAEMRATDSSLLRKDARVLRRFKDTEQIWDDESKGDLAKIRGLLTETLDQSTFQIAGLLDAGRETHETNGERTTFKVVAVILDGEDHGYGPFRWRATAYLKGNELAKWEDLPVDQIKATRTKDSESH